jgi:DNA-binding NarL/FixJ family response regulator
MKGRLFFVDDDQTEIDMIRPLVEADFYFEGRPWPFARPLRDAIGRAPDIFVLDLYLPPAKGPIPEDMPDEEMAMQQALAQRVSQDFSALYLNYEPKGGKKLLQRTMACLTNGRGLLDRQWTALRQSPKNGIALMNALRKLYPNVPVVFYSRKITPADVVNVLRAGAFDAIQKGSLTDKKLCARLESDIALSRSQEARQARQRGHNFNLTMSRRKR